MGRRAVPAVLVAAAAAAVLGSCGQAVGSGGAVPTSATTSTASPANPATSGVVLRVARVGGYVTPSMLASRLPLLSVYADGRVITEGPVIALHPPPALPNLQVQTIPVEAVATLVERAVDAGVGADPDLGRPGIADATTTRFTVVTATGVEQLDAYALTEAAGAGPVGRDLGLTPRQLDARAELIDLLAVLTDLPTTLGTEVVSDSQAHQAQALAAIASPWVAMGEELGEPAEVAWPGPDLPGEPVGPADPTTPVGCVMVTGDDVGAVLAAASAATTHTPWTSAGGRWSLSLRPLLPDEEGCADLAQQS